MGGGWADHELSLLQATAVTDGGTYILISAHIHMYAFDVIAISDTDSLN